MLDRRLIYVVATARAGSFTAAAERVGVTQSAITKSVADLERQLGFSIFNRLARGVILTQEGQSFVERASHLIDQAQDLLRGPSIGSDPYAGVLKIGVSPPSIEWLLVEPLTALISRHPAIRLDITGVPFERAVQQLRSGSLDIVLGFEAAFAEQPDFRIDAMPPMRTTFFVRQDHPILELAQFTTRELSQYEMISPSDSRPYDAFMRHIYEENGIDAQTMMHFIDYFPIVSRMILNTDAIGVVSVHYTQTRAFQRRFARLPFLETQPLAPLCCATRLRLSPRPAVRAFIKACRERLPATGPLEHLATGLEKITIRGT